MIGISLAINSGTTRGEAALPTAFSPLRARLSAGQNATIFVNGDSTAYVDNGPFQQFAAMLGDFFDVRVVLHRWAEWQTRAASGPRAYADPVTLRPGAGQTLTIYLAALPGGMAGFMLADQRQAALKIPRPDLCIIHHGHNMQSFEAPGGISSSGRSALLGPLGMTEWQWPGTPQLVTTQNPWRDSSSYDRVYNAILDLARAHPGLTLVDTHAAFMTQGKDTALYRDNILPSDAGYRIMAQTLFKTFLASPSSVSFETPSWPKLPAANLIANGDFTDWSGSVPAGWSLNAPGTASKAPETTFSRSFAHSLALRANGSEITCLTRQIRGEEAAAMAGKAISFAVLYKNSSGQRAPLISLVAKSGGALRTINTSAMQFGGTGILRNSGWMWATANDIAIDRDIGLNGTNLYIQIYPAYDTTAPSSNDPLYLQRVIATEGGLPKGNLSE